MHHKAILHLDLDAFFASVEQRDNSRLKGKPVLIGGTKERGVVAACSYEARHFGIHSAMPMRMALRLCPDAIVIKGDMEHYARESGIITEIIANEAPLFEKASIDEFYLDLTGMDEYFGCFKWSKELRQKIVKETGLPSSFGLSVNKLVAKVGTGEAKPNGIRHIETGREKMFLAPLSVKKLPSVGSKTFRKLTLMGVRKIKTLSEIPPRLLEREFGKHGVSLWKKANAIDDSPVVPHHDRKSMSTERTFAKDTIDVRYIKEQLKKMVTRLAFDLRNEKKLTALISVKIRYTDFNTYSKQCRIPHTANDKTLLRHVYALFDALYQRRQLIRLVGIRFGTLTHGHLQINMFDDTRQEVRLLEKMDALRQRFGQHIFI